MHFKVLISETRKTVDVVFGNESDVRGVSRWRAPVNAPMPVRDALEFAHLASKRWRYYRKNLRAVLSVEDFAAVARQDLREESCLILLARAAWFSDSIPLGLLQCRRSFCNRLIVEFLSVHPRIVGRVEPQIRGVGSGLVLTLAALAFKYGIDGIWGEATAHSSPFYQKTLGLREVKDHFHVEPAELKSAAAEFYRNEGSL
jgi:hypothetical protein